MVVNTNFSPELVAEKKRRRKAWIVTGIVALFALAVGSQSKEIYGVVKGWRARRLAANVEQALAKENWADAARQAHAAYQLNPTEPAAIRAVARFQSRTGRPASAIPFWQQLLKTGSKSVADQQSYAADLLSAGAVEEAVEQVRSLLSQRPNDPETLRLAAKLAAMQQRFEASLDYASRARKMDPGNAEGKLLLSTVRLQSPLATERTQAIQELLELGRDRGKTGLQALMLLGRIRTLAPGETQTVVDLLKVHPLAGEAHRLLALELEIKMQPGRRENLLDRAMEEQKTADPAAKLAFAVWLNTHEQYQRALALLPLPEARQRKDFLLVHLDALAALKRWHEIQQILDGPNIPLDEAYSELFLARSSMELGEINKADLHWRNARLAAAPSAEQTRYVAEYAEKIGQTDQALLAYRSLTPSAATARPAYEALLRLAQRRGDAAEVQSLLGEMQTRWPSDPAVRNDCAYLNLLAGREVKAALETAQQLVVQNPTSLPHRTTLALAYLRSNDAASALKVYDNLQVPWERVAPNQQAIHAAVLGANGKTEEARAAADAIRDDALRAEERDLIKPWQTGRSDSR